MTKAYYLGVTTDLLRRFKQEICNACPGPCFRQRAGSVTKADIKATNGVIHVIDSVLLPPGLEL
jgi:hypothetical protein